jgi:transcriptional antiterminator
MDRSTAFSKFEKMKWLIERSATGSPKEFAQKIEVSERTLCRLIKEIQDLYKIEVAFSYQFNSYIVISPPKNSNSPDLKIC